MLHSFLSCDEGKGKREKEEKVAREREFTKGKQGKPGVRRSPFNRRPTSRKAFRSSSTSSTSTSTQNRVHFCRTIVPHSFASFLRVNAHLGSRCAKQHWWAKLPTVGN